ncbi:MAG: sugar phosphate isomerase/epimerase [Clostridia bacterium]|nr:sugar phosphate isomerase/epimerase [Clostridia bacterium]
MLLSACTGTAAHICPDKDPFVTLKEIGYDACDFGDPCFLFGVQDPVYLGDEKKFNAYFEEKYKRAQDAGIVVGQVHAPFPTFARIPLTQDQVTDGIRRAVLAAAVMHAPYLVVHPAQPYDWSDDRDPAYTKEVNYKIFSAILPTAVSCGVCLALENMPSHVAHIPSSSPEEWRDYVDMMDSPNFRACLDTGHANMAKYHTLMARRYEAADYVRIMEDRIVCLHVHDNNGMNDQHTAPRVVPEGHVLWDELLEALKETGYKGTFSLESDFALKMPEAVRLHAEQFQHDMVRAMLLEHGL